MDAAGVIAYYVMDGNQSLTAESNGNTTFYLYGLGAIGEKTVTWNFALPDGSNTPRQLTDTQGDITLSARYTPWGDTLDTYGTGGFTFGYFGGVMDAATGLLYVGNGQYYDPSTGRFLTRGVNPDSTNPYVPWNPIGAILGPLGLIALVFGRRKKGSKTGTFLVLALVTVSVEMTLSACGGSQTPPAGSNNTVSPVPAQTQTPVPTGPGTSSSSTMGTAISPIILTLPECPTATFTPTPTPTETPTPTATPNSIQLAISYLQYSPTGRAQWNYLVAIGNDKVEYNTPGDCRALSGNPILVPEPSCAQSSPTYIAGSIAHEAIHISHRGSDSLWEEYKASLVGDIVRNDVIQAGFGTSSDLRFPLRVYTVNLNNPNKTQFADDLKNWFKNNNLSVYYDPVSQGGYGWTPLP